MRYIPVKLPWIFLGAPLNFNGTPGYTQGNLTGMEVSVVSLISDLYFTSVNIMLHGISPYTESHYSSI